MTPTEKLNIFTKTIITVNYKSHPLYNTFLNEWEFKINFENQIVEELYLFDEDQNIIITHKFQNDLQHKYFKYFKSIGIIMD